jgi:hypothetical protein
MVKSRTELSSQYVPATKCVNKTKAIRILPGIDELSWLALEGNLPGIEIGG